MARALENVVTATGRLHWHASDRDGIVYSLLACGAFRGRLAPTVGEVTCKLCRRRLRDYEAIRAGHPDPRHERHEAARRRAARRQAAARAVVSRHRDEYEAELALLTMGDLP